MRPKSRALTLAMGLTLMAAIGLDALPRRDAALAQGQPGEPPSACAVRITETAQTAARICQPLALTVTLQVTRPQALPLHVVFVVAKHLLMFDHLDEAKAAARDAANALSFGPGTRVGLVTLSVQGKTELELSDDKSKVLSAINRIKLDQVRPEARYYDWLSEAEDLLAEARDTAVSPVEIIYLVSTGCPVGYESYCQRQKASASRVQGKGITVIGVCNPSAFIPPPALPANHCNDIRGLSSSGSYYDLRQASRAAARLQELERDGAAIEPRSLALTELLAPGFSYVPGSGLPEPKVNASRLLFEWTGLSADQVVSASYRLQPEAEGVRSLRLPGSNAVVFDSLQRASAPFDVPTRTLDIRPCVVDTATPSPSPTAGATASPTASATLAASPTASRTAPPSASPEPVASATREPSSVFLPILMRQLCKPARGHTDVVLLIDASSSMAQSAGGVGSRLDAARQAARRFIDLLALDGGGDQLALGGFNADPALGPLSDRKDDAIRGLEAEIRLGPGTRIDRALESALSELTSPRSKRGNNRVIVLLTDGLPEGGSEVATLDAALRARQAGVDVYAIGFGDSVNGDFLRQLASRPEAYLHAPDPEALRGIYESIAGQLPCPGGLVWELAR